jgi:hypothetical protein
MKAKSSLSLLASLVLITFIFTQCQKGDVGPAGPAGPTGSNGAPGAAGPKGDTGTANVIYSAWLDVTYAADTIHTGAIIDTVGFYATITALKLTNAILNSGEVKVYLNLGTSTTPNVIPLPYYDVYTNISIQPDFSFQKINLYADLNASTYTNAGQKLLQYRYILIPGSVPSGRIAQTQTVNWNNYNEVKAYLNLKD